MNDQLDAELETTLRQYNASDAHNNVTALRELWVTRTHTWCTSIDKTSRKKRKKKESEKRTWSPASMPSQGPTWYSHWPGSTSCWCCGSFGGCGWCALNPSTRPNPARFIRLLLSKSTHAVDPGDGDLRVEAGTVVRLGDVPAEGILEARRAVVGALCVMGLVWWLVHGWCRRMSFYLSTSLHAASCSHAMACGCAPAGGRAARPWASRRA